MISTETGSVVEWSSEMNYKFRLSKFCEVLLAHYTAAAELNKVEDRRVSHGVHPDVYQNTVIQDLKTEPLVDLSISRPRDGIRWGIPVPEDPTQAVRVWFDALLVYLSGTGYPVGAAQQARTGGRNAVRRLAGDGGGAGAVPPTAAGGGN